MCLSLATAAMSRPSQSRVEWPKGRSQRLSRKQMRWVCPCARLTAWARAARSSLRSPAFPKRRRKILAAFLDRCDLRQGARGWPYCQRCAWHRTGVNTEGQRQVRGGASCAPSPWCLRQHAFAVARAVPFAAASGSYPMCMTVYEPQLPRLCLLPDSVGCPRRSQPVGPSRLPRPQRGSSLCRHRLRRG